MPIPFHMSLTGETQGNISAKACTIQGRENTILCQALNHELYIPRDPQTGLPTGKRVHQPLTITKAFDRSSPLLYEALTNGEVMREVKLEFYRIAPSGKEEVYFTITLKNAIIVSIKAWVPNALDPSRESFTHMEDVSFTYRDITWEHNIDGTMGDDSWVRPKT